MHNHTTTNQQEARKLRNQRTSTLTAIKAVNEQWSSEAIKVARDFLKGDKKAYDRKTDQLAMRETFEKDVKALEKPLAELKKAKNDKTVKTAFAVLEKLYDTSKYGDVLTPIQINLNNCVSCALRVEKAVENALKDRTEKQIKWLEGKIATIKVIEQQMADLGVNFEAVQKPAKKRGRPPKSESEGK